MIQFTFHPITGSFTKVAWWVPSLVTKKQHQLFTTVHEWKRDLKIHENEWKLGFDHQASIWNVDDIASVDQDRRNRGILVFIPKCGMNIDPSNMKKYEKMRSSPGNLGGSGSLPLICGCHPTEGMSSICRDDLLPLGWSVGVYGQIHHGLWRKMLI